MFVPILLLLVCTSAHGRVAVHIDKVLDIASNLIDDVKLKVTPLIEKTTEATTKDLNEINESKIDHTAVEIESNTTATNSSNIVNIDDIILKTPLDIITSTEKTIESDVNNIIEDDKSEKIQKADNGTALILTPLIEEGKIDEARIASKVDPSLFSGVKSHSGFLTVNKTYDSNTFFWYFPVENKPVNETPWIIWLQGGPGASSLAGLFDEIGPFLMENGIIKKRPHSWNHNHSLVFIDNPVGTGFSFTNHVDGLAKDMETYSQHLYTAVHQLLQLFPELKTAPLYVAGESYAGKYVPCLALELHRHRTDGTLDINLQGLIVGNGYVEPSVLTKLTQPFASFGLLVPEQLQMIEPLVDSFTKNIALNKSSRAREDWNRLIMTMLYLARQKHAYNYLQENLPLGKEYQEFVKTTRFKRAVHVGDIQFTLINITVYSNLSQEFLASAKEKYETLLEHYRVLAYCGNLDQIMPCVSTSENYRTWKWSGAEQFVNSSRRPLVLNHTLVGYHKTGGRFTEAIIIGAGHMVPSDKPQVALSLINSFTHGEPIPTGAIYEKLAERSEMSIAENLIARDEEETPVLILTPYIEEKRIEEGRNASKVDASVFLGFESYSGFLTVNKTYNSNTFFWYFPAENSTEKEAPWIIWLQGGPGVSSLTGLFEEIGPLTVDADGNLERNPNSWLKNFSLVFIDNPVGTGYSYTEHRNGYVKDMETYSAHLYTAVAQLVQLYPELQRAPLYVAGESYAGKYVPSLALELHRHKMAGDVQVNLKGLIMGNALIDPSIFENFTQPFYHSGLLSPEDMNDLKIYQEILNQEMKLDNRDYIGKQKWLMLLVEILSRTHQVHAYNFVNPKQPDYYYTGYLHRPEVRRALHVGDMRPSYLNTSVNRYLAPDFLSSASDKVELLLEHYQVLAYCGQLDHMVPCSLNAEVLRRWNWTHAEDFKSAPRSPYYLPDYHLTGYVKTGGNLTEAVIRNAGHMAARDRPAAVRALAADWARDQLQSTTLHMFMTKIRVMKQNGTALPAELINYYVG
ncbi:uncharacterized protein LOC105386950 [Plutella xylostella]|uniref:uncharacterized protein LOC105386950 n=1 Tax=Plutella xylostella TaxID=51655 RepID=UPI002032B162|nr:uncharacterized protein LOC105386950 [Plutella xylostella]